MDDVKPREGAKAAELSGSDDEMKIMRLGDDIGEARTSQPAESSDAMEITRLGEDREAGTAQPADSPELAESKEPAGSVALAGARKTAKFPFELKITQQTRLIAAMLFIGLVAVLIFSRATGSNKAAGEGREERTVASLTPESLIAKCGQAAEDVTKDLYPMIKRTMSYKSGGKGTLTLEFSRTAEEKSEWVFLSMSDENGATYDTPEMQMAAMPCLK
ncbi:MAG TPA: hypothetical protein VIW93_09830 [Candidatus Acidoferrum sp.]